MPPKKEEVVRLTVGAGQEYPTLSKALAVIDSNETNTFHVVTVLPGTYNENVVIKKPLEIIGERLFALLFFLIAKTPFAFLFFLIAKTPELKAEQTSL